MSDSGFDGRRTPFGVVAVFGILSVLAVGVLTLPSCSGGGGYASANSETLEQQLERRVAEFWETRILAHEIYDDEEAYDELLAKQFDYWDPEFKKQVRLSDYRASRGSAIYEKFKVVKTEVDGDVGWVEVQFDWRIARPPSGITSEATRTTTNLKDSEWLLVDGTWFKKFDAKKAFGHTSAQGRRRKPGASTEKKRAGEEAEAPVEVPR